MRYSPQALVERSNGPLSLAAHGGFFAGTELRRVDGNTYATGQTYVEYLIPTELTQPWPVLMIHGGGSQGLDFLSTPDGREGWAHAFARRGFAVYVLDRPGCGRASQHPEFDGGFAFPTSVERITRLFSNVSADPAWPAAVLHSQWPGTGDLSDPAVTQFAARLGSSSGSMESSHEHAARIARSLLSEIGPAIVLTHSLGGPWGWIFADASPTHIKAVVAVEPFGPPYASHATGALTWGLTATPLQFSPPVDIPEQLQADYKRDTHLSPHESESRSLAKLTMPILVVTAEASWQAHNGGEAAQFLRRFGADVDHLSLADAGLHGNGHAPMMEKNSAEVASELMAWLSRRDLASSEAKARYEEPRR